MIPRFLPQGQRLWVFMGCLFFLAFPFSLSMYTQYVLFLVNMTAIGVIGAVGLNILTGYTGMISMGQAAFMGVGAYTVAILGTQASALPVAFNLLAAGFISMIVGIVAGMPSLRLKGFYLAMATLAAQFLLEYLFKNWEGLTKGVAGISVAPPIIFGVHMNDDRLFYFIAVPLAVIAVIATKNLFRTNVGRSFIAIRDRDIAAGLMGINVLKYRLLSFAISSFFAGLAGGLWCYYMTIINPEAFQLATSIDYIAMIIIGGMGTILGSVYGAIFVTLLPEVIQRTMELLQPFLQTDYTFAAFKQIVFGFFIALFLIYEPRGLAEIIPRMGRRVQLWVTARHPK
ncbi:MAG: leucine/isoleucine/valine transporter permease subunit [Syntrophaceae bacterium PtaU1.Bin231]|nr:MAG: leucine/isoleucine/valine transporter permease subunit [Syntrophaceae bacterium PtaU1.Bin231]